MRANHRFPANIEIDPMRRKPVMPSLSEMENYAAERPHEGMPLATAGLTAQEYAKVMKWLEEDAAFQRLAQANDG